MCNLLLIFFTGSIPVDLDRCVGDAIDRQTSRPWDIHVKRLDDVVDGHCGEYVDPMQNPHGGKRHDCELPIHSAGSTLCGDAVYIWTKKPSVIVGGLVAGGCWC